MKNRKILKFNNKQVSINCRDDSDLSVIDEFFVDKMYRSIDNILPNLKDPILDIGAHIGMFSIYASILNPNVKIIALEPEPDNYKLLKQNLKQNHCKNVVTKQIALVSPSQCHPDCSPDEVQDEMDRVSPKALAVAQGSLSSNNTNTVKLYLSKDTHTHSTTSKTESSIKVPATTLAKLITQNKLDKIGLLKMDIEGAEFQIAIGLQPSVFSKIQNMVIEYHPAPQWVQGKPEHYLTELIRSNGFSVEHFPNHFDKRFGLLVCRNKSTKI